MLKTNSFFVIQSFMVTDLGLSGNDLMVYAIIYGFSQDGESVFRGSRQYLANWCNSTVRGIQKNLNRLMELGLIKQVYHSVDNHEVHYKAIVPNKQGTDEQSSPSDVNKVHECNEQSSLNNIVDNIEDKIDIVSTKVDTEISGEISSNDTETISHVSMNRTEGSSIYKYNRAPQKVLTNEKMNRTEGSSIYKYNRAPQKVLTNEKPKKKNLWEKCMDEIDRRYKDTIVYDAIVEYLGYRLKSTIHRIGFAGWVGLLNKLDTLGKTDEEKCKIIEQSIKMKWDTFAELKTWGRRPSGKEVFGENDNMRYGAPVQSFRSGVTF